MRRVDDGRTDGRREWGPGPARQPGRPATWVGVASRARLMHSGRASESVDSRTRGDLAASISCRIRATSRADRRRRRRALLLRTRRFGRKLSSVSPFFTASARRRRGALKLLGYASAPRSPVYFIARRRTSYRRQPAC